MSGLLRYHGLILISAEFPLAKTAQVLGQIMQGFDFREDTSGTFEEVPTFVARIEPFKVLLHGVSPDDESEDFYTLSFQCRESVPPEKLVNGASALLSGFVKIPEGNRLGYVNVSEYLKEVIDIDGRLKSELPNIG